MLRTYERVGGKPFPKEAEGLFDERSDATRSKGQAQAAIGHLDDKAHPQVV